MIRKKSVLLGIYIKQETDRIIGVAEIYNYEPEKEKASIGYRIHPYWWKRGIATETAALLKSYLLKNTDVRKITAHVMAENVASARVLEKNGFNCVGPVYVKIGEKMNRCWSTSICIRFPRKKSAN